MADEAPQEQAPQEPQTPVVPAEIVEDEQRVPYDRFKSANDKAKAYEKELKEVRAALDERDQKDMSDLDRARKALERSEQRASQLEQRTVNLERGSWLRAAAGKLDYHDPGDAFQQAKADDRLAAIEDERDAERFVKELAKQKPHLVKAKEERPQIGKVLANGQPAKPDGKELSPADAERQLEGRTILDVIEAARKE